MTTKLIYILMILMVFGRFSLLGQDRFLDLESQLLALAVSTPSLNEPVALSVDDVPIEDFIRMLSKSNNLNISIQEGVKGNVINDFNDAKVKDVFILLCKEFQLDIEFIGSILFFKPYLPPEKIIIPQKKEINISYNQKNEFLSVDLKQDDISEVARLISEKSGKSVVVYPLARGTKISSFIQNRSFENVLDKIATSHGLIVTKTKDNFFIINKELVPRSSRNSSEHKTSHTNESIEINIKNGLFSIEAIDAPISEIIQALSEKLNINYFFYGFPTEKTTLNIDNMSYEEFLSSILVGTKFTFKKNDNVFLIGERKKEGFRSTELLTLKNRSVEKVIDILPTELTKNLQVNVFNDLNGIVVSGSSEEIYELKMFVNTIDIIVPVVTIDLIIVEVNRSNGVSGGIESGIGNSANTTNSNGAITPGLNINLSTNAINGILQSITGLGVFNLGNVAPNFYMNIQALETNQILKIKSTPKIATLNGEKAVLSIGATEYYLETNNQVVNTGVNQNILNSQVYKSLDADLKVTITPFVSEDEQISLSIDFQQETFTGRINATAPPGKVSRNFNSVIRVKNNDMVLLGGLEEEKKNNSGSGFPGLSRIPVLKWFFGKRIKEKSTTKLHIFIRPNVTY